MLSLDLVVHYVSEVPPKVILLDRVLASAIMRQSGKQFPHRPVQLAQQPIDSCSAGNHKVTYSAW